MTENEVETVRNNGREGKREIKSREGGRDRGGG